MTAPRALVLVVDDEPINIEVMAETLETEFEVICAGSGPEALTLARTAKPDLVFLDVIMPGMDGYEVCAHLKADPCTNLIPIIFVTALGGQDDEERGLRIGAIDYVTKPISPPLVRARARNHVELKRARDQLVALAQIDRLTGLANRRAFDSMLKRECNRHVRNGAQLSVILADIDHFQTYISTYGHTMGDECLCRVARVISETTNRPADLAARIDDDSFACVLPETSEDGAQAVANRIRQAVQDLGILRDGIPHERTLQEETGGLTVITVSVGRVTMSGQDLEQPSIVLSRADRELYAAKVGGRNRVSPAQR